MGRTVNHSRNSGDPVPGLVLLLVGVLSLCLAVIYPMQQLTSQTSPIAIVSGSLVVVSTTTLAVVAGLLIVSASATTLGVLVLFLRL